MIRTLAFALGIGLFAAAASAQQSSMTSATPGVPAGTTGTTYGTPGAMARPSMPGGSVPQSASTQDASKLPTGVPNYSNSGGKR